MDKKLTTQKLFEPFIKWLDQFFDTVESTEVFKEDDELVEEFGIVSNNFDMREFNIVDEEEGEEELMNIKEVLGEPDEIIELNHEEMLEMLGFTDEEIEADKKIIRIDDFDIYFSTENEKVVILNTLKSIITNLITTYNIKISHLIKNKILLEEALDAEHLAIGGSIRFINNGKNLYRERYFLKDE